MEIYKDMPGSVVLSGDMAKRKGSRKSCRLSAIFTCNLPDLVVWYRYVARHGCLPLWFRQQSRQTGIETIVFRVTEKGRVRCLIFPALFLLPVLYILLCVWVRFRVPFQKIAKHFLFCFFPCFYCIFLFPKTP